MIQTHTGTRFLAGNGGNKSFGCSTKLLLGTGILLLTKLCPQLAQKFRIII
jgi:hypothetical protein